MPSRGNLLRLIGSLLLVTAPAAADQHAPIVLIGDGPGSWKKILSSIGLTLTEANSVPPSSLRQRVEEGAIAILEGTSEYSDAFGIRAGSKRIPTRSIVDARSPRLPIIWEKTLDLPEVTVPPGAQVFAAERWTKAPVLAGIRAGKGAVLWLAARPGERGYERFPFLLQALQDLGVRAPVTSNRLWAFLDSSYRTRADVEYIADRWMRSGIAALHVAAWHYNEADDQRDAWLKSVIDACHRRGILVYAWLELPHVSERFWAAHPEWREKTALLQDAHLDWRKLMNLNNPDCARAVAETTKELVGRFDWDGVNLAELYFESLEGAANPARFTPMNDDIRSEYKALTGTDPLDLFQGKSTAQDLASFLQYRAGVVRRMQRQWMSLVEAMRASKPQLDVVLTHVDDRFDSRMRELIGADAAAALPMLTERDFTFLIEDPATVWHLGPERYEQIAQQYAAITPRADKLAIDINIVERYQDVYPTKQQTGVELMQLVSLSSAAFPRVALYFENSILPVDAPLLPAAAAAPSRVERTETGVVVDSKYGLGVLWDGPAKVDGRVWPFAGEGVVWLPPGGHVVERGGAEPPIRVLRFNGDLQSASAESGTVEFAYRSSSRALATLSGKPRTIEIDGEAIEPQWLGTDILVLPRGQHVVTLR